MHKIGPYRPTAADAGLISATRYIVSVTAFLNLRVNSRSTERNYLTSICLQRAKFHYASWFEADSKLVADLQRAEIWPII